MSNGKTKASQRSHGGPKMEVMSWAFVIIECVTGISKIAQLRLSSWPIALAVGNPSHPKPTHQVFSSGGSASAMATGGSPFRHRKLS